MSDQRAKRNKSISYSRTGPSKTIPGNPPQTQARKPKPANQNTPQTCKDEKPLPKAISRLAEPGTKLLPGRICDNLLIIKHKAF